MIKRPQHKPKTSADLSAQIGSKARRKLHTQQTRATSAWSGLGLMGLVGWSIVVPTLLGASLGLWLDSNHPGQHSWTLALLMAGLTLGCFNAWHWIEKEDSAMREAQPPIPADKEHNDDTTPE